MISRLDKLQALLVFSLQKTLISKYSRKMDTVPFTDYRNRSE